MNAALRGETAIRGAEIAIIAIERGAGTTLSRGHFTSFSAVTEIPIVAIRIARTAPLACRDTTVTRNTKELPGRARADSRCRITLLSRCTLKGTSCTNSVCAEVPRRARIPVIAAHRVVCRDTASEGVAAVVRTSEGVVAEKIAGNILANAIHAGIGGASDLIVAVRIRGAAPRGDFHGRLPYGFSGRRERKKRRGRN